MDYLLVLKQRLDREGMVGRMWNKNKGRKSQLGSQGAP